MESLSGDCGLPRGAQSRVGRAAGGAVLLSHSHILPGPPGYSGLQRIPLTNLKPQSPPAADDAELTLRHQPGGRATLTKALPWLPVLLPLS